MSLYIAVLFVAAVVNCGLAMLVSTRGSLPGIRSFIGVMLAGAWWAITSALEAFSWDLTTEVWISKLAYLGKECVPVFYLLFALGYTRLAEPPVRVLAYLWIVPALTVIIAMTNELHGLMWSRIYPAPEAYAGNYIYEHGSWFYMALGYNYLLVLAGSLLLFYFAVRSLPLYRQQAAALLSGVLVSWLANAWYIFGWNLPGMDLTPIGGALTGFIYVWGVYRLRLFELVPVARSLVFDEVADGVLVLDMKNRILDYNQALQHLPGVGPLVEGSLVTDALIGWPELVSQVGEAQNGPAQALVSSPDGEHSYEMRLKPLAERSGKPRGRVIVLQDITARLQSMAALERVRANQAIADERRRIAREIHDGLAQDLASLRMRARLWYDLVEQEPAKMREELDELRIILKQGINEVRRSIFALRPVPLEELGFFTAVEQLLADFEEQQEFRVDLEVNGEQRAMPAHLEEVLYRVIQEGLSNISRHAQASRVWVQLDLQNTGSIGLVILDDGIGFDCNGKAHGARKSGLGLMQMRERVEAAGGTITIQSQPESGTALQVVLPMENGLENRNGKNPRPDR
ncbi:MAG: hypothetical protein JW726_17325 [Anaerolineales bacterium]|nr:hypothetical protein [Anaerolineales bacterium]